MTALRAHDFRVPMVPWPSSIDVHEQDGHLVVTAEPTPLDPIDEETESEISARGWELFDQLALPFRPDVSRVGMRLVHGCLELDIPLPAEPRAAV